MEAEHDPQRTSGGVPDSAGMIAALAQCAVYSHAVLPDGSLALEWLAGWEPLTGYTEEELTADQGRQALVHPADGEVLARRTQLLFSGLETVTEYRIIGKDGHTRWVQDHARPCWDQREQRIVRVEGAVRESTDARQARETVRVQTLLLGAVDQAIIALDLEGTITYWNRFAEVLYGWTAAEAIGRGADLIVPDGVPPEHAAGVLAQLRAGKSWSGEFVMRRRDGSTFTAFVTDSPMHDETGALVGMVGASFDRSEHRRAEQALALERDLLDTLMDAIPDAISFTDAGARYLRVNAAYAVLEGLQDPALAVGKTARDLVPGRMGRELHAEDLAVLRGGVPVFNQITERRPAGAHEPRWLLCTKVPMVRDGQVSGLVGISRDITELRRAEADLDHQAAHDTLTGLPNRHLFLGRAHDLVHSARRRTKPVAVLVLDLNRFREVNDALGPRHGDHVLRQLAERLERVAGTDDLAARLDGDEFAMLLPGADREGALAMAVRVAESLEEAFVVAGQPIHLWASTGIALYPGHGTDTDTLLRHAEMAMYVAKRSGESHAIYTPEHETYSPDRFALIGELRQALARGEISLQYQPQVDAATGSICGVEALARWQHAQRGTIPPDQFIPLAEETGLIVPLTDAVLARALAECARWRGLGWPIPVAVNVSASTLLDGRMGEMVPALLRAHDLPPGALRLEVTESTLMADPERACSVLTGLSAQGVGISIDDFGIGYSSLSYLKRLPVDELKVDRSFVQQMLENPADTAIVCAIVGLGHSLGLEVVAEGVESQECLSRLALLECDRVQGYFISRPISPDALRDFFSVWPTLQESVRVNGLG